MNVLSLCDGMSCAQIAMQKAGWKYDHYFASEIDKHSIRATMANFTKTIQLGNICCVRVSEFGIECYDGVNWNTRGPIPDIIFAGFPCQDFSNAGKKQGFDGSRGGLFFELVRILNEARLCNPNVLFLFENVEMIQEWQDIINKAVGIMPVKINSSLVSAQNRVRLYWTNIGATKDMFDNVVPGIRQPKNLGITLKDILQQDVDEKYFINENILRRMQGLTKTKNGFRPHRNDLRKSGISELGHFCEPEGKTNALIATHEPKILIGGTINNDEFKANKANKANNIDSNYFKGHDNHGQRTVIQINPSIESGGVQPFQQNRIYHTDGIAPGLAAQLPKGNLIQVAQIYDNNATAGRVYSDQGKGCALKGEAGWGAAKMGMVMTKSRIRRLTPIECSRLQAVPDEYLYHAELMEGKGLSDTQRYKMLGNGWQIDTIVHILKHK